MKTASHKIRRTFISAAAVLFAAPLAAQAVTVDGQFDDWNLETDFSIPMYRAGDSDPDFSGYEELSKAYLRYDSKTETAYVLVLDTKKNADISVSPGDAWVKIYEFGKDTLVDGNSADFAWVTGDEGGVIGWEGSFPLEPGEYSGVEIHVNHVLDNIVDTSSTGKRNAKGVDQTKTVDTEDLVVTSDKRMLRVKFIDDAPRISSIDEDKHSADLIAGQHTDVGSVSVELENRYGNADDPVDTLVVTYDTEDGWYLDQTHLWVEEGNTEYSEMPANKKGNPKIGNFTYVDEYIIDTTHTVKIPLSNFGELQKALCGDGMSYSLEADMAAHASVYNYDSGQQETAWSDGYNDPDMKGSWFMVSKIEFTCE